MPRLSHALPALALLLSAAAVASELPTAELDLLREAALSGRVSDAAPLFDDSFVAVSQSGKVYSAADLLFDLGSGFESWENRDIVASRDHGTITITFINQRRRRGMATAEFRVLQTWTTTAGGKWRLLNQASVALPKP